MSSQLPTVLDFDQIDEEVQHLAPLRQSRPIDYAPPTTRLPPLPGYVTHREGATVVGRLSAEAVVRECDAMIREIEAMGSELQDAAKRCEAETARVHAMVAEVKEVAAAYRDEAKGIFLQIESVSLMTEEVRKTCAAMKAKIAETAA